MKFIWVRLGDNLQAITNTPFLLPCFVKPHGSKVEALIDPVEILARRTEDAYQWIDKVVTSIPHDQWDTIPVTVVASCVLLRRIVHERSDFGLRRQKNQTKTNMKTIMMPGLLLLLLGCSQQNDNPSLKPLLLEQLKNTHTNKNWFVPINAAVEGLTAEQANRKDSPGNHSIGELVSHLIFWNERNLIAFQGNKPPDFSGDNKATFKTFDQKDWDLSVKKIDSIQTFLEQTIEKATDKQLGEWSSDIVNICAHNAYHTGQIVYIRKKNGWWDEDQGVK